MTDTAEILYFSPDPTKRRRSLIQFWIGLLVVLSVIPIGNLFFDDAYPLFLLPLALWSMHLNLSGSDNPFRRHNEIVITATAIKGAGLKRANKAYFMLDNLMMEPILLNRNPPRWLQWLIPARSWIAINHLHPPYGFKIEVSLLSDEDQRTVFQTLKQRYDAVMSPTQ